MNVSAKICRSCCRRTEHGGMLLLSSFFIAAALGLVALVVDLNIHATARLQAQGYARLAALAAIEQFFSNTPCLEEPTVVPCSYQDRLDAVLARVNEIVLPNSLLWETKRDENDPTPLLPRFSLNVNDALGVVEPGRWILTESGEDQCPAGEEVPCFRLVAPGDLPPNSFRVRGRYLPRLLTTAFGRYLGIEGFPVNVHAVSAVVPRHGVILIDTTPSLTFNTHGVLVQDPLPEPPNEYRPAYLWDFINDQALPGRYGRNVPFWTALKDTNPERAAAAGVVDRTVHYADDFVLKRVLDDSDYPVYADLGLHPDPAAEPRYSVPAYDIWYRVDAFRQGEYQGPEPMRFMFEALTTMLTGFRNRRVAGDQMSLVFFDNTLQWPRIVRLTDNFDYLLRMVDVSPPLGGQLVDDEVPPAAAQIFAEEGLARTIRHSLFPHTDSMSDVFMGLSEALKQLFEGRRGGGESADFVILVGDYLPNCFRLDGVHPLCSHTYGAYQRAIEEVQKLVQDHFIPGRIPIHVLVTGEHVGPSTIDWETSPGSGVCYTDAELRALGDPNKPYVKGDNYSSFAEWDYAFKNAAAGNPFYQSNVDSYQVAALTQGMWFPLRPPAELVGGTCPQTCNNGQRRTTDPLCRSVGHQVNDFIRDIMGANPYEIVEVR